MTDEPMNPDHDDLGPELDEVSSAASSASGGTDESALDVAGRDGTAAGDATEVLEVGGGDMTSAGMDAVMAPPKRRSRRAAVLAGVGVLVLAGLVTGAVVSFGASDSAPASVRTPAKSDGKTPTKKTVNRAPVTTTTAPTTTTTVALVEGATPGASGGTGTGTGADWTSTGQDGGVYLSCPSGQVVQISYEPTYDQMLQLCGVSTSPYPAPGPTPTPSPTPTPPPPAPTPPPPEPLHIVNVQKTRGWYSGPALPAPASQGACNIDYVVYLSDGRSVSRTNSYSLAAYPTGDNYVSWSSDPEYGSYPSAVTYNFFMSKGPSWDGSGTIIVSAVIC